MSSSGGAGRFQKLSVEHQARYKKVHQRMVQLARDHAVPIIFAPPLSKGGHVNGATGCMLQTGVGSFIVTASHVLAGYEERCEKGEILNWQVGDLPPFDPIPRVAWRDKERDIVLLRLFEEETHRIGPCIIPKPHEWPPLTPREGDFVLVAGYPKALRELDPAGTIGAGPYSAMLRVTTTGEGYCTCQINHEDLISYDGGPLPNPAPIWAA